MGIFSSDKPQGKCSHGGEADLTSTKHPRGGISKDERRSDNVALHNAAVTIATAASLELLMGIARSAVVCFVIDTTGSMSEDIEAARAVIYEIVDSKKGTQDEPSEYILVPFNDPDFGPMIRTTDPDKMKSEIAKLRANGGGDAPEMCLSGLLLALTGAPSSSYIYVFTDAAAKDFYLKATVIALTRSTKSTSCQLRRLQGASFGLRRPDQVSKKDLPQATGVILDTSTSALGLDQFENKAVNKDALLIPPLPQVTVIQRARNPGKQETFPFMLDESLKISLSTSQEQKLPSH
ncbi:hypothetical protein F7725_005327 [Dissostichus mawsoni]|uniref:VWFA domain-containing protein n=1 Tax=Dissostichus mawsoni TaxID=36200 RepID=A0A7J5YQX7_DISMA|nr:hypothetical protein F7725_005327 [Dissostichus mawsoni]